MITPDEFRKWYKGYRGTESQAVETANRLNNFGVIGDKVIPIKVASAEGVWVLSLEGDLRNDKEDDEMPIYVHKW